MRFPICHLRLIPPCIFLVFLSVPTVHADIAFANFNDGDSFGSSGFLVGHLDSNNNNIHFAFEFTSGASGVLSSIDVAAGLQNDGGVDAMEWTLWTSSGSLPGSTIWTDTIDPSSLTNSLFSMPGGPSAPVLNSGEDYWLSARSRNGLDTYHWAFNTQTQFGDSANDITGGTNWNSLPNNFQSAFRVNLSAVPEPSTAASLFGFGVFTLCRRQSRHACR